MISTLEHSCFLQLGESYAPVTNLSEFGFSAPLDLEAGGPHNGTIEFGGSQMEIEFRVRQVKDGSAHCTFANLSIKDQNRIQKYVKDQSRIAAGNESLEERTYDELAEGIVGTGSETPVATADANESRARLKALAVTFMVVGLIALVILATVFLKSRSSLTVDNAALVGNFLPINSKVEGEVVKVFVTEGEYVQKGDLLMRLRNSEIESLKEQSVAAHAAAEQKVIAYQAQLENYKTMLGVATQKLELDLEVAKSELESASKSESAYRKRVERFQPFLNSGSISQAEFDEAQEVLLASEATVIASKNAVRQIEFSQRLAKKGVLILGDRVDDEMGRLQTSLEIAQAEAQELKITAMGISQQAAQLEIRAPRDGQVYSTYRQQGEFLKVADEAIALSYPGKTWAAGQVGSYQADRVRPGQPVTIRFPSLNRNLDGIVLAVGHRALYSKGGYNADFRGTTATDVPIKVLIEDLPEDIPSGIRMEMAINTGFGVNWLDNMLGYELQPIGIKANGNRAVDPGEFDQGTSVARRN